VTAPVFQRSRYDAVLIGSGPNGLAAAVALAKTGLSVLVVEAGSSIGGGTRTEALTLPGFLHDVCSSVHPLGLASPFFRRLGLERYGLSWIEPPTPLAHVLDVDRVVTLERAIEGTAAEFGGPGRNYRRFMERFVKRFDALLEATLGPLRFPDEPLLLSEFGLPALRSLEGLARGWFREEAPRALLAGIAAHAMLPLDRVATASFGLLLAVAGHAVGWPIARGGSRAISDALAALLRELGGEIVVGLPVRAMSELPEARAYLFDTSPRAMCEIAGAELPDSYRARLRRFRYGPGVCKVDWALSAPIPWRAQACSNTATVHLAGTLEDVARSEARAHAGELDERPFVILTQPSLFDDSRAPDGQHVAWAYCHVPHGSDVDATRQIEAQVERAAPGFHSRILARSVKTARSLEQYNPNYIGGDINGGLASLDQLFFRPLPRFDPYSTPSPRIFLCSSATPPGGGVHGMCGYWAARSALRRAFESSDAA
jgi:phytoene dehydrogenase-like protein